MAEFSVGVEYIGGYFIFLLKIQIIFKNAHQISNEISAANHLADEEPEDDFKSDCSIDEGFLRQSKLFKRRNELNRTHLDRELLELTALNEFLDGHPIGLDFRQVGSSGRGKFVLEHCLNNSQTHLELKKNSLGFKK